ncbi:HD domain-containing protein [Paenibacillus koleovorans]|uniref:HD domain-containing protein n=1 Tax=Paenibacillus koleovorans TaxID=121608 RepID=UPI000FD74899|nr:HD domain-containing protein [Paenibacillus koleovorans]
MTLDQERVLAAAETFARDVHGGDRTGHDWPHIERVARLAASLAEAEGADRFICALAALLHDVPDEKLNASREAGEERLRSWLDGQPVDQAVREHVLEIIGTMSFSGGHNPPMRTHEGRVVQDADRLDALGAIGIARTFVYAGSKGHAMHDPALPPRQAMSREEYRSGKQTAVNHFYEKLLLLKDRMNTAEGRRMAEERHRYMELFLDRFVREWDGV